MLVTLVIPILDDWESADVLCTMLNATFQQYENHRVTVLFVDDGSTTEPLLPSLNACPVLHAVKVLRLKRNLGHQRAIAVGLSYIQEQAPCDVVVVMDGDGEDKPEDVPRLLEALAGDTAEVVFAERGRRLEGAVFRASYSVYRLLHRMLTGHKIRFGNFSAARFALLRRLTVMPEMWSHYAASVILARVPFRAIRLDRGKRLKGATKMNIDALLLHGLAAIALYPVVYLRVLIGSVILSFAIGLFAAGVVVMRLATDLVIPGLTSIMVGASLILLCITLFMSFLFVFLSVGFRTLPGVLPVRDYRYFVECCQTLHGPA